MEKTSPWHRLFNNMEVENYSNGGAMVWSSVMLLGHTELHVFQGSPLTDLRYKDVILASCESLLRTADTQFIFWTITFVHTSSAGRRMLQDIQSMELLKKIFRLESHRACMVGSEKSNYISPVLSLNISRI
ncbi:hypothetical protein TNCV_489751 [Trichonephila clavipes]|nr:hypothetical protein TNCV_489751 [Trichonephila clavipes]